MHQLKSNSIDLIITSPPYPMIEMWDEIFSSFNGAIKDALEKFDGKKAFEYMHQELDKIWDECYRVLKPAGIICINIGDATRKIGSNFQMFPNHSRIIEHLYSLGFYELPSILWRKQTNAPNKFMGSGMIPSNAYVTLEHEYILIFKKGKKNRKFKPKDLNRYQSAYFWEERNNWFSDIWMDLKGTNQILTQNEQKGKEGTDIRERSAAFPFDIPYRLISMFSIYGDIVLDPFFGTGTTTLAAMVSGRNSVGFEIDKNFINIFDAQLENLMNFSSKIINERIEAHKSFIEKRKTKGKEIKYKSRNYGFDVITKQEEDILLRKIQRIKKEEKSYIVEYFEKNASNRR